MCRRSEASAASAVGDTSVRRGRVVTPFYTKRSHRHIHDLQISSSPSSDRWWKGGYSVSPFQFQKLPSTEPRTLPKFLGFQAWADHVARRSVASSQTCESFVFTRSSRSWHPFAPDLSPGCHPQPHPGFNFSVEFRRNSGFFFVSASYREKKFRYFLIYFVFKFKIQQISTEIQRNSPKFTEIPFRNFGKFRNGIPFPLNTGI